MALLGPAEVRSLAAELDVRPTKQLGQNFVHDANTVRRIVASAGVGGADTVLEVGPGLGSLTLALLDVADAVIAVEIDPKLAGRLPQTAAERAPSRAGQLTVVEFDALRVKASDIPGAPSALVANLPYNVAVPVLIHLFSELPSLRTALVMVQAEVADRLAADPGSKVYGMSAGPGRMRRLSSAPVPSAGRCSGRCRRSNRVSFVSTAIPNPRGPWTTSIGAPSSPSSTLLSRSAARHCAPP